MRGGVVLLFVSYKGNKRGNRARLYFAFLECCGIYGILSGIFVEIKK
jgi:hypothetical protein